MGIDPVEYAAEAGERRLGGAVSEFGEGREQGSAFDQCADGGGLSGAPNRVALPVAGDDDAKMLIVRTRANTLASSMCCTSV